MVLPFKMYKSRTGEGSSTDFVLPINNMATGSPWRLHVLPSSSREYPLRQEQMKLPGELRHSCSQPWEPIHSSMSEPVYKSKFSNGS